MNLYRTTDAQHHKTNKPEEDIPDQVQLVDIPEQAQPVDILHQVQLVDILNQDILVQLADILDQAQPTDILHQIWLVDILDLVVVQILQPVVVDVPVDMRKLLELQVDIQVLKLNMVLRQVDRAGCTPSDHHNYTY